MLDQFRAVQVGNHDGRLEGFVDCLHRRHWPVGSHPDDDPVGFLQIRHGTAFSEKLRIAHNVKLHPLTAVTSDRFRHMLTGFHRHRAFIHDDPISGEHLGNFPGHMLDINEIDRTVFLRRGRHRNKDHLRIFHGLLR